MSCGRRFKGMRESPENGQPCLASLRVHSCTVPGKIESQHTMSILTGSDCSHIIELNSKAKFDVSK